MHFPNKFAALGDGDAQNLPGLPRDSGVGGGGRSSRYPQAGSRLHSTLLYLGEVGSVGLFLGWRPEVVCQGGGGGAGTQPGFARSVLTPSLTAQGGGRR